MKAITVTTHATGGAEIQDPFPADGRLVVDVPANTTKIFNCNEAQYSRIKPQLDAFVAAGILSSMFVNELDAERTNLYLESANAASPGARTGHGRFFSGVDGNPYFMTGSGTLLLLAMSGGAPITFVGTVAVPGDFPTPAAVDNGWMYIVTADVTDNDVLKTNTGQSFMAGDEIVWNGTTWSVFGAEAVIQWKDDSAAPLAVSQGNVLVLVDTVTAAGFVNVNLPAASASTVSKVVKVVDVTGAIAPGVEIGINPNGVDTIDGIAAGVLVTVPFGGLIVTGICMNATPGAEVYGWSTMENVELRVARTRLDTIGAGRQMSESYQLAAATETLRVYRALEAGQILRVAAEVGTAAAAGESMTLDVEIAGVSCLTAPITIDDTTVIDTPVAGVVNPLAVAFAAGDLIRVVRTYVAGVGPTPMQDTVATIETQTD